MSVAKPLISIVIPTHNRSPVLSKTLAHLAKQEFGGSWEVIVVNNRSTDDTDAVVERQSFPVSLRLIHEDTPGPAAARNAGAAAASGDYVIFMDNDIIVEPDFIERHHGALQTHPSCWIVGQVVNLPEQQHTPLGRFRQALSPFVPPEQGMREVEWIGAGQFSLPRADLACLGGFDEKFLWIEDLELAMRARQAGIIILFDPSNIAVHNDWAGFSIRDYCMRQRLYSQAEILFWLKYGMNYPRAEMVCKNLPPVWRRDDVGIMLRKLAKQWVGGRVGQAALIGACTLLEQAWPWPPVLWRAYRLALAGAIYRGFQEGIAMHKDKLTVGHL